MLNIQKRGREGVGEREEEGGRAGKMEKERERKRVVLDREIWEKDSGFIRSSSVRKKKMNSMPLETRKMCDALHRAATRATHCIALQHL